MEAGFIPTAFTSFLEAIHLLNTDIVEMALVLPQRDVLEFVDFPWKALPVLRCEERVVCVEGAWIEQEKGKE